MPRYEVDLSITVTTLTTVEVEGDSEEEAGKQASDFVDIWPLVTNGTGSEDIEVDSVRLLDDGEAK